MSFDDLQSHPIPLDNELLQARTRYEIALGKPGNLGKPGKKKSNAGRPRKWTLKTLMGLTEQLMQWLKTDEQNPDGTTKYHLSFEQFFVERDIWPGMLRKYAMQFAEFGAAIQEAKEYQASKINDLALRGVLNGRFAIFSLSAKHRWTLPATNVNQNTTGSMNLNVAPISISFKEIEKKPTT